MSKLVFGIDPDSAGNGVAVYLDDKLIDLQNRRAAALYLYVSGMMTLHDCNPDECLAVVEDVAGKKGTFHGMSQNKAAIAQTGKNIGKCQQAQAEAEEAFELLGIEIKKYPISSKWKTQAGKKQFELVTGWSGRSNEDTRSAAYFGFLAIKR